MHYTTTPTKGERLNVLGICAGLGGLELGLHAAEPGARTVCFVEKDEFCQQVLRTRFPGVAIWDDLTTFDPQPWVGIIDVVAAGFPCQPVSCAGMRLGIKDPRWLWPWIAEIIRVLGPQFVFLENVPGLLTAGLGHVLGDLAEMDFRVETGVFSCGSLGASHLRNRVAILAHSEGLQCGQGRAAQAERPGGPVRLCEGLAAQSGHGIPGRFCSESETAALGHAHRLRGRGDWVPVAEDSQAEGPDQAMDDPDGNGQHRQPELCGRDAATDRPGKADLANGDGSRLPLWEEQPNPQFPAAFRGGREVWAPGPDCDWQTVPREFWPSEYPVCGVADGLPGGVDFSKRVWADAALTLNRRPRLRALGNAVSPPACAAAWTDLKSRMMGEIL